jgi:Fe-S cluster assembly protein SufD
MNIPVSLPCTLFIQQHPALAERYDLAAVPASAYVLYVPPYMVVPEVLDVRAYGDACVIIADVHAQVCVMSDQTKIGYEHKYSTRLYAYQSASIKYTTFSTGSNVHHIELHMLGHGSHITVHGIYGLTGNQKFIMSTKQEHTISGATSTVLLKGILGGQAVAEYTGNITIAEHATQSNAAQQAATLMVSPQARSRSIPSLQVLTNDVRCKHGSAVGQLNQDQLFYAQARGLSQEQAQHMLLQGFLAEATEYLPTHLAPTIIARILNIF